MSIDATADQSFRKPAMDERLNVPDVMARGADEESNLASELDVARLFNGRPMMGHHTYAYQTPVDHSGNFTTNVINLQANVKQGMGAIRSPKSFIADNVKFGLGRSPQMSMQANVPMKLHQMHDTQRQWPAQMNYTDGRELSPQKRMHGRDGQPHEDIRRQREVVG